MKSCKLPQDNLHLFLFNTVYEDFCLVLTLLLIGVQHVEVTDRKWTRDGTAQDAKRKSVPGEALPHNEAGQVDDAL